MTREWAIPNRLLWGLPVVLLVVAGAPAAAQQAGAAPAGAGAASVEITAPAVRAPQPIAPAPRPAVLPGPAAQALRGALRRTVGALVPLPGTELLRMGIVQEAAVRQASERVPATEALGAPNATAATITVVVHAPR